MNDPKLQKRLENPSLSAEHILEFRGRDLLDLCEATEAAIEGGGGFGWVTVPEREVLERFWRGVLVMPLRELIVARLDGVICGSVQLSRFPPNNQAQAHVVQMMSHFLAPWARGYGLAKMLVEKAEQVAREEKFEVINLDVRETMTRAMELYEAQGFVRIGEHPSYAKVDGRILKGYYYCKMLTSSGE